jgi:prevent-host-death family protein
MMEITSTEAQNNFGRYLKLARFEDIIVTKNGKPTVVIKPFQELKEYTAVTENAKRYSFGNEKISYEDFMKLTEASENRYEYIDGDVYLLASPTYDHQATVAELFNTLYNWFKGKKCRPLTAPFDVTLITDEQRNVVQPDIIVICDTENINDKRRYTGTPALVVEVLSETTQKKDMVKKLDMYLQAGIKEYWIINPLHQEVYSYSLAEGDIKEFWMLKSGEILQSTHFPGLVIPLADIFSILTLP